MKYGMENKRKEWEIKRRTRDGERDIWRIEEEEQGEE